MKLFFVLAVLFLINNVYAYPTPGVHVVVNKKIAKIGGLVSLSIKITGPGIENINWRTSDDFFAKNGLIIVIGFEQIINRPGLFVRDIVFTVTKPGNLIVGPVPVVIKYANHIDTVFSEKCSVNFLSEKLPLTLNEIETIAPNQFFFEGGPLTIIITFCIAAGIFFLAMFLIRSNKKKKPSIDAIRRAYLQKIQVLEEEINSGRQNDYNLKDDIFWIFKEYVNQTILAGTVSTGEPVSTKISLMQLNKADEDVICKILRASDSIRFSQKYKIRELLKTYLDEVKMFIKKYPTPVT